MGKSCNGFIAGIYRPQLPKRRRHTMTAKNNVVMVDKVKEIAKNCRREKMIKRNTPRPVQQKSLSKVETFQFNKGRPKIDKQERKMVKRNLFGMEEENDRKSSVDRKLRADLKVKKKLFETKKVPRHARRQSKNVDVQQSVLSERVSSWVSRHHPRDQITSTPCQIPHPMKPSSNFFSMEENPTSFSARVPLPQIPVSGPSWDENPLDQFSSAASHTIWEGSTTRESFTDKGNYLFQENLSPKSIPHVSPVTYKFGRHSSDVSFSSNFSFQDTKLSSLSFSTIDNGSIHSIPSAHFPISSFHNNNLFSPSYSSTNNGSIHRTKCSTSSFEDNNVFSPSYSSIDNSSVPGTKFPTSSFEDNLFSHSNSNIDNGFISSTNFPTSSVSESWIASNWMPEDECTHGSPVSNVVARVLGGKGGRGW